MVSRTKPSHFGPSLRVPCQLKQSKIMKMSRKEFLKTRLNMTVGGSGLAKQYPPNNNGLGRLDANIVEKSDSESNRVHSTSKDTEKPTSSSLKSHLVSSDKQKITALSRTMTDPSARLKKSSPLKKKEDVLEISQPTRLKAMSKLAHKGTKRSKEQPNYNQGDDIIAREDGTKKLKLFDSKEVLAISIGPNTPKKSKLLVSKNNFSNEFKEIRDEIVSTKEDHARSEGHALCDDCYKQEGTESLEELQGYSQNNSSFAFGTNLSNCQVDQRGLIEVNFASSNKDQVANSYGKTNNGMTRKRKETLLAENPKTIEDNDSKYVGDNMDSRPMKEPRCVRSKDEAEGPKDGGAHIPMGVTNDITRSLSQVAISMDGHAKVSVPSLIEQQHHCCCSRPIDKSSWSGIFKIDGKEYISLAGHLSNKSCQKVWGLSTQLAPLVELKSLLRSDVWPKAWEASKPNDDNIGMYFFPRDMRQDKDLDQLIKEVMENDLVLRAIIGDAEMLIFPSNLLPNRHQTFQTKHYLWGVFKPREDKSVVVADPLSDIGHCAQEIEKEKQQHVLDQQDGNAQREELDREIISMTRDVNHLLRAKNTQVEGSHVKGSPNMGFDLKAPEEGTQVEATLAAIDAPASPANHGQIDPSMGLPTSMLMGFVVRQTPKLEQLIQEMKREGALIFAMEGESLGAGSWPGVMPTAVQK